VGFEHTIPGFQRAKPLNVLDCVTTVTGLLQFATLKSYYTRRNRNFAITVYVHLNEVSLAKYGVMLAVTEIKLWATEIRVGYT
jgi:hypothetical protein